MLRASGLFSMAVAALAATFDVGSLAAQNNASATVSATVQQPITVTKNSDLSFGNVFPGVDKSIAVTAGSFVRRYPSSAPAACATTWLGSRNSSPVSWRTSSGSHRRSGTCSNRTGPATRATATDRSTAVARAGDNGVRLLQPGLRGARLMSLSRIKAKSAVP